MFVVMSTEITPVFLFLIFITELRDEISMVIMGVHRMVLYSFLLFDITLIDSFVWFI